MEPTTHNKMPGPGERGGALKNGPKPQNHGLFSKKSGEFLKKLSLINLYMIYMIKEIKQTKS